MLWIDCKMKIGIELMSCLEVHGQLGSFLCSRDDVTMVRASVAMTFLHIF